MTKRKRLSYSILNNLGGCFRNRNKYLLLAPVRMNPEYIIPGKDYGTFWACPGFYVLRSSRARKQQAGWRPAALVLQSFVDQAVKINSLVKEGRG